MQVTTVVQKTGTSDEICSFHLKIETQDMEGKTAWFTL